MMSDKISNKNIADNSTEVSLRTTTEFEGSAISGCFFKNPRKFTIKQANIMENLAKIFTNNQAKDINKISDKIGKKLETVTTNSSTNKKVVRQAGESYLPAENEPILDDSSGLDKQIGWLVDITKNTQINLAINNCSESGQSDEDGLIKDIANDFSVVEKTSLPIGKKWLT